MNSRRLCCAPARPCTGAQRWPGPSRPPIINMFPTKFSHLGINRGRRVRQFGAGLRS
jgi:hypothetical protein